MQKKTMWKHVKHHTDEPFLIHKFLYWPLSLAFISFLIFPWRPCTHEQVSLLKSWRDQLFSKETCQGKIDNLCVNSSELVLCMRIKALTFWSSNQRACITVATCQRWRHLETSTRRAFVSMLRNHKCVQVESFCFYIRQVKRLWSCLLSASFGGS